MNISKKKSLEELKQIRDEYAAKLAMREHHDDYHVVVGMGTCGIAAGARAVVSALAEEVAAHKLYNISVTISGCFGECELEPMVEVTDSKGNKVVYGKVKETDAKRIVEEHLIGGKVITELLKENL